MTTISCTNPMLDDEVYDSKGDASAGATRVRTQLEKSTEHAAEKAVGHSVIEASTLTRVGGGVGNLASQALLVIGWVQTFSLVSLIELIWPVWWYSLWGWLALVFEFPFKVLAPVQLLFPDLELDSNAQYAAVLAIQPLLGLYTFYRYKYFEGYTFIHCCGLWGSCSMVWFLQDSCYVFDATEYNISKGWVRWNTGIGWKITLVGWLCVWILPPILWIQFVEPLRLIQEAEVPHPPMANASHNNTSIFNANNSTTAVTIIHEGSSRDHYVVPLVVSVWICLFAFVPFIFLYKIIVRSAYHTSQNRNEPEALFFGHWARKECQVLIFLVVTTYLSAVVTTMHKFRAADGWTEHVMYCVLCVLYGLVPAGVLLRVCKNVNSHLYDAHEEEEEAKERDTRIDRLVEVEEAYGNHKSFEAGILSTLRPFERKYWFGKSFLMVEKVALAVVVLGFDDVRIQMFGALIVLGIGALLFILTRPFALFGEDFTEIVARSSNCCVLVIGILVHQNVMNSSTGDWLLVVASTITLVTFVFTLGPVRLIRELRAFATHQAAAVQVSGYNQQAIKELDAKEVATMSQVAVDLMSNDQLVWLITEHGDTLKDSSNVNYIIVGDELKLSLKGELDSPTLDASNQNIDPSYVMVLAWWLTTPASAALAVVTCDSTGDPQLSRRTGGPKSYTLNVEDVSVDLSSKNFGPADVTLLAAWIQRPEVSAVINQLTVDSTGDTQDEDGAWNNGGSKTYTLTNVPTYKTIELSAKNLGPADVALLTAWMERPEVSAAVKRVVISYNFVFGSQVDYDVYPFKTIHTPDADQSGWSVLCDALPGSAVEELVVADIGMGVTGVTSLAKAIPSMAALAQVDIRGAHIKETDLEALRAAAPDGCEVVWKPPRKPPIPSLDDDY